MLSSLIVKFSDVQAENFYFQVKFINCYLREIISFTKNDIRDWGQSRLYFALVKSVIGRHNPNDYRKIEYNWKEYPKRPEVVEI